MTELCEVVITAPDPDWLVNFTRQLVADGLCSSGHNYVPVRSIYKWRGEVHDRTEGRVSLHTRRSRVAEIVQRAKEQHPYEVPGISTRPIDDGNPDYLRWIAEQTGQPQTASPRDTQPPRVKRHQPPYVQIADAYRQKIDENELSAGTRLPPTASIAAEWNVSVATAHKALRQLASEHRIRLVDKQGAWVAEPGTRTPVTP